MKNSTLIHTLLLTFLALTITTQANTPNPNETKDFLDTHNQARAAVGVPLLKWSNRLAEEADRLLKDPNTMKTCGAVAAKYGCNQRRKDAGINIPALTPREAVDGWLQEKKEYEATKKVVCCFAYKQMVWRNATELGCAQENGIRTRLYTVSAIICLYTPPGYNYRDKPY